MAHAAYYCKECGQELPPNAPRRARARPGQSAARTAHRRRLLALGGVAVVAAGIIAVIVVLGNSAKQSPTVGTPKVTIAPSARVALESAAATFSQQLAAAGANARAKPLDFAAQRADAAKTYRACLNFESVITELKVPAPMNAHVQALLAATRTFCAAINATATSNDAGFSAAVQSQTQQGFAWTAPNQAVFRDLQKYSGP